MDTVKKGTAVWREILSVRGLLFKQIDMSDIHIKDARLAITEGNFYLCNNICKDIELEFPKLELGDDQEYLPEYHLFDFE